MADDIIFLCNLQFKVTMLIFLNFIVVVNRVMQQPNVFYAFD